MAGRGYNLSANRGGNKAPEQPAELRTKPVRVTVDYAPGVHRKLKRFCNATAAEFDLSRVDLSAVLRILSDELLNDEKLAERVYERLQQGDGSA